jgi:hypothetical protein
MRIGAGQGPGDAARHQSSHYVYDVRSGVIVSVHHFVGAAPKSEAERREAMLKSSHEGSGVALEHLAVLSNPDLPAGEGELRVEPASRRFVRRHTVQPSPLRP